MSPPLYLNYFGLNALPFRLTPGSDCFFDGADRGAVLNGLAYALMHGDGIVALTGEIGSGKTTLSRVLIDRAGRRFKFVYIGNPSVSRDDLIWAIAYELGIPNASQMRAVTVMRLVQKYLIALHSAGRQVVLIVDEAQAMPADTLQELRLLSNLETSARKLLQIVLIGQPELLTVLAQDAMRPLRERIAQCFTLSLLTHVDVSRYLIHRLRQCGGAPYLFSPRAVKLIAKRSCGSARRINVLADKCLLAAYLDGAGCVQARHARTALRDVAFQFGAPAPATLLPAWLSSSLSSGSQKRVSHRL